MDLQYVSNTRTTEIKIWSLCIVCGWNLFHFTMIPDSLFYYFSISTAAIYWNPDARYFCDEKDSPIFLGHYFRVFVFPLHKNSWHYFWHIDWSLEFTFRIKTRLWEPTAFRCDERTRILSSQLLMQLLHSIDKNTCISLWSTRPSGGSENEPFNAWIFISQLNVSAIFLSSTGMKSRAWWKHLATNALSLCAMTTADQQLINMTIS